MAKDMFPTEVKETSHLSRWRMNSPFTQTLISCIVVIMVPGMNSTLLGLGAGGGRAENIPIVDKANIVGASVTILAGFLGGSINNKIGPRWTLMVASASYPLWSGSLWYLDHGNAGGVAFLYAASVYHGVGAGLLYATTGFIVSSYSTESERGRHIASFWAACMLGSLISAVIVLIITTSDISAKNRLPASIYIAIIAIQSAGVLVALFLVKPSMLKRNDGRKIAIFKVSSWVEEVRTLARNTMAPRLLLLIPIGFSSQISTGLTGSLNGFYFNARTRTLLNVVFWLAARIASGLIAVPCDSKFVGNRRSRAIRGGGMLTVFTIIAWAAMMWFLASHNINRYGKPNGVDWKDGSKFSSLLLIWIFIGASWAMLQTYVIWVVSTFTNDPSNLAHFCGLVEAMKAAGLAVSFGIDSHNVAFLTEAGVYFALIVTGLIFCIISAGLYTTESCYGKEEMVMVPEAFEEIVHTTNPPLVMGSGISKSTSDKSVIMGLVDLRDS